MTPNSRESNPEPFSFPEYYRTPSPVGPIVSPARSSSPVEPSLSPPRSFSPLRRSRDRVRRDPSKYRFSYERSRSQRTLSSDYHQNQQPSSSNSRGSRSLSPQTWETSRGFRLKNLRCLTLVKLPKHLKSRQLEVELMTATSVASVTEGLKIAASAPLVFSTSPPNSLSSAGVVNHTLSFFNHRTKTWCGYSYFPETSLR